jgi:hypothetical protein
MDSQESSNYFYFLLLFLEILSQRKINFASLSGVLSNLGKSLIYMIEKLSEQL